MRATFSELLAEAKNSENMVFAYSTSPPTPMLFPLTMKVCTVAETKSSSCFRLYVRSGDGALDTFERERKIGDYWTAD